MKLCILGLDGATWEILGPLVREGQMPQLTRLIERGASGTLNSVFPPLSPVAWTAILTGKNSGQHGIFEFVEHEHDPQKSRVNSSRSIRADLIWEIAARHGLRTISGGVPMSYPPRPRPFPGAFLGDFLAPENAADFASDPDLLRRLEAHLGEPYQPWDSSVHDGHRESKTLASLTGFLQHHLRAVEFLLAHAGPWDLFVYDLMAVDRIQHELWHAWDPQHRLHRPDLEPVRQGFIDFWRRLDDGIGRVAAALPDDTTLLLLSDHGFGPIEYYVNFNVWLLDHGFMNLKNSFYVRQKKFFYDRGICPEWFYGLMARWGAASTRVSRFRGKQLTWLDRLADKAFLSREHIDWSRTKAYAQGNFGQIFLNLKGRQPFGCVDPADARSVLDDLKAGLFAITHPETGEPLVAAVHERDDLYHGPHAHLAPDLTVVLGDWRYRTIGLYDFTTNQTISPAFGPTGDHRIEGVFIAAGPGICPGATLAPNATLLDITPTALRLLGVAPPEDLDGRILSEVLDPADLPPLHDAKGGSRSAPDDVAGYTAEDEAVIQKRLADLGYLG